MEEPKRYHFVCIPYINLGEISEIDLGFAKIWNFDIKSNEYIPDEAIRKQVKRILSNHKSSCPYFYNKKNELSVITGIGIVSGKKIPTNKDDKLIKQIQNDARLILFISFLDRHNINTRNVNSGHSMASSENFSLMNFSIVTSNDDMTEYTGFVLPKWIGGIDIDKNLQLRPKHVPTPRFDMSKDLSDALILLRKKNRKDFRRVISAIEVFFESYYNSTEVSHNARILLQASAFEILLNSESGKGREKTKAFIKKNVNISSDRIISFKSERGKDTIIEQGTIKERWADSFFTLRNHIVHGDLPKQKDFMFGKWQRHFDVALYFFIFILKRKIEEALAKEIFNDDISWNVWVDDLELPPKKYSGFQYNHYGARGYEKMLEKIKNQKVSIEYPESNN